MQRNQLLIIIAALVIVTGCKKKSDDLILPPTPGNEEAQVTIVTNWGDIGTGIEKPAAYIISTTDVKEEATADRYTLSALFEPGSYTFYLYNRVTQLPVTDGVAKVATVDAPEGGTGTFIHPQPGWLFTATGDAVLKAGDAYELAVTMQQQVRQLTLLVQPEGGTADQITAIEGVLTGVAGGLHIKGNTHTTPANVVTEFKKITEGDDAGKWSVTLKLLGISGSEQTLAGTIRFGNGTQADIPLESDLTTVLADFNTNKNTPLTLAGLIVEVPTEAPTEAPFTATIKEWHPVTGGEGVAK